ncbi:MAG: transcriptional repressor [Elusimicrobia bacterium]|nr:transcriptional repressor [Elusimicrobiota bacterium]
MKAKNELIFFPKWVAGRPGYAERIREVFEKHLEESGLRLTRQRREIMNYLLKTDRHLELEEIYQALRKYGIGRATVFRTLRLLEESKLVDHVTSSGGASRYEIQLERPHHDHLICIQCGGIQEVRWPELEAIQDKTCRQMGFEPSWHRHEIFGRCRRCAGTVA